MPAVCKLRQEEEIDVWPAYVDAMAAVLLAVIFIIVVLIFSQFYLEGVLVSKEADLKERDGSVNSLNQNLVKAHAERRQAEQEAASYKSQLNNISLQMIEKQDKLSRLDAAQEKIILEKKNLELQTEDLIKQLANLQAGKEVLTQEIESFKEQIELRSQESESQLDLLGEKEQRIHELEKELNQNKDVLKNKSKEYENLYLNQLQMEAMLDQLKLKISEQHLLDDINRYRSEFFERLGQVIGHRKDMHVVGDRFVFQSEILFDVGSAEIGVKGREKLQQLASVLKEIAAEIPKEVHWILRIDGHTDPRPIHNEVYKDNWELSLARAASVVRYLVSQGIEAKRLAATGFGASYPLNDGDLSKDRRIEFKLDQR